MLSFSLFDSKFGLGLAVYEDATVVYISLGSNELELIQEMKNDFRRIDEPIGSDVTKEQVDTLKAYLHDQSGPSPQYSYHFFGTEFQRKVWDCLIESKRGETFTYSDLAERLGLGASSSRAVANAVGANKISILIPCHRVVRKNGDLGGYRWGVAIKKKLLSTEQRA